MFSGVKERFPISLPWVNLKYCTVHKTGIGICGDIKMGSGF